MFWNRRKEAIKLAHYVLFIEAYKDLRSMFERWFCNYALKKADEEARKKGYAGIGRTKWWQYYLKVKNSKY